jgi:hypothetical protein
VLSCFSSPVLPQSPLLFDSTFSEQLGEVVDVERLQFPGVRDAFQAELDDGRNQSFRLDLHTYTAT